jgi:hypothetical protein
MFTGELIHLFIYLFGGYLTAFSVVREYSAEWMNDK